jgi:hypothetical protein
MGTGLRRIRHQVFFNFMKKHRTEYCCHTKPNHNNPKPKNNVFGCRQCAPNYYAVLGVARSQDNVVMVNACLQCLTGTSPGGLVTTCTCASGFTSFASLAAVASSLFPSLSVLGQGNSLLVDTQSCVDCFSSVSWLHVGQGSNPFHEALACAGSSTNGSSSSSLLPFHQCNGPREYVDPVHPGACAMCTSGVSDTSIMMALDDMVCNQVDIDNAAVDAVQTSPPRNIPLQNRTGCRLCPPGTYIASVPLPAGGGRNTYFYDCAPCSTGHFQPSFGQCSCMPKRQQCPPGQRLVQNVEVGMDRTRDYSCTPCNVGCADHEITIYAPGNLLLLLLFKTSSYLGLFGGLNDFVVVVVLVLVSVVAVVAAVR